MLRLEMLARLRGDGCHRQADADFGQWVKTLVLFLAFCGPNFMKFWNNVGDPSKAVSRLSISRSSPEILVLKVAIELQSR